MLSKEIVEELRTIIKEDFGRQLSEQEAYEVAQLLVGSFGIFVKGYRKQKEININVNDNKYVK